MFIPRLVIGINFSIMKRLYFIPLSLGKRKVRWIELFRLHCPKMSRMLKAELEAV